MFFFFPLPFFYFRRVRPNLKVSDEVNVLVTPQIYLFFRLCLGFLFSFKATTRGAVIIFTHIRMW